MTIDTQANLLIEFQERAAEEIEAGNIAAVDATEEEISEAGMDAASLPGVRFASLKGQVGAWDSNQGSRAKSTPPVVHYNGPATGVPNGADPVARLIGSANYHRQIDWGGGARANGLQYHSAVWGDTVYLCRNPLAILWHCAHAYNYTSHACHVPIGGAERATDRTLQTLKLWFDEINRTWGTTGALGHRELSSTDCPGTLQADFIAKYRAGHDFGVAPTPVEEITPSPKIWLPGVKRLAAGNFEEKHLDAASVMTLDGHERAVIVPKGVAMSIPKPGEPKEPVNPVPVVRDDPNGSAPADPETKRLAAVIDGYFASLPSNLAPYTPVGAVIVDEAKKANLHITSACALVEQESAGRNVFGADWGTKRAEAIPFAHLPVTRDRVQKLVAHARAGGVSNGVGLTQITWRDFIYDAENRGGAHIPKNQCAVGFELLAGYYGRYPYLEAIGAYNAGESNRRSVVGTYSKQFAQKHEAWRARLGVAGESPPEAPDEPNFPTVPSEPPERTPDELPEKTPNLPHGEVPHGEEPHGEEPPKEEAPVTAPPVATTPPEAKPPEALAPGAPAKAPVLGKAAKAIVAAAVPLIGALLLWAQTGTLSETEFTVALTGLLTALLVYFVPNATDAGS